MIFIIILISITLFILYKVFHTDQDTDFNVPKRTNRNKAYFEALEKQKRYDDFCKKLPDIKMLDLGFFFLYFNGRLRQKYASLPDLLKDELIDYYKIQ